MSNKEKSHMVIPILIPELEPEKKTPNTWYQLHHRREGKELDQSNLESELRHGEQDYKNSESEGSPGPKIQSFRKGNKSKNLINKEFEHLKEIKRHKKSEKNLEFRKQEELETIKRRAIAVHHAKVPKSHLNNGSDIQKMLESRRKQFREILKKEFDKCE
ncbi:hypothetical protein C1646_775554 [Rhizophagus diaphanus]|nr:hypothetical protein C1646_775554 [Rhizophagus diaphanus] [Rhizophagus sp. MUCL 43196]